MLTRMAPIQPDTVSVILTLAAKDIVGKIRLCYLVLGIHNHLAGEREASRNERRNVEKHGFPTFPEPESIIYL